MTGAKIRSFSGNPSPGGFSAPPSPVQLSQQLALINFNLPSDFALRPDSFLIDSSQLAIDVSAFVLSIPGDDPRSIRTKSIAEYIRMKHCEWAWESAIFEKRIDDIPRGFMGIQCRKILGEPVGILQGLAAHPDFRGLGTEFLELAVNLMGGGEIRVHPAGGEAAAFFVSRGFEIIELTDGADMRLLAKNSSQWTGQGHDWRWKKN